MHVRVHRVWNRATERIERQLSPVNGLACLVVRCHVDLPQVQAGQWVVVVWMLLQVDIHKPF